MFFLILCAADASYVSERPEYPASAFWLLETQFNPQPEPGFGNFGFGGFPEPEPERWG